MFGLSNTVISEICNVFKMYPDIEEVLIFGSRAKGNYRTGSDIDLAAKGKGDKTKLADSHEPTSFCNDSFG